MELRGFGDQIIFKELPGLINRKRAYDQQQGIKGSRFNGKSRLPPRRPFFKTGSDNEVGTDQAREEHHFRDDENHLPENTTGDDRFPFWTVF